MRGRLVEGAEAISRHPRYHRAVIDAAPRAPTADGTGILQVARGTNRSVVCRAFAASPLKLLTPRNHGDAAWVYTATYGGGLVNGDALRLTVDVGADAKALLTTQASTKVYRSPQGTSARLDALVGENGLLILAPDPVVCFAASTYRQTQHVELGAGAGLVLLDWVSSGRRGAGERWAFDRYSSRTTVMEDGRLMLFDGLELCSRDGDLAARMGRFDVVAIVVMAGAMLRPYADRVIGILQESPVVRRADLLQSASPIGDRGAVLRIAGTSVEVVGATIREHLRFVPSLLGDDPWARKW